MEIFSLIKSWDIYNLTIILLHPNFKKFCFTNPTNTTIDEVLDNLKNTEILSQLNIIDDHVDIS